ncbi:chemotaxis protein [Acinetobacter baumannii]|uniref:chemotaxis protein n=1 Tax=Acinetobacter baumannii TaxID=470 RepID=UPI0008198C4D|nr:chemotaxis protein [Acinetobacter baumannii]EIB7122402.1 chemotaxis protein [Acinetobacter baumannii]MCT9281556.1 chemotaxis protein [Acinetobacter baumannii]MDA5693295.1 chemotaxis protein [Acinetobacter baumannii]MDC4382109.1 chemotaxis protein [Acinetobacter baumannii]OTK94628.1 chemotaxis protein [Acinetobacter baumannii]
MSEHNSIQFDPTALLIIKNEIDNSIKLVEGAVSTLIEEQALPFGIDDALEQFKQCTQVLRLIDIPYLAKITQYSTELMQKIMANPEHINTNDVVALSEGTTMVKRYIEFICLREVEVPQFLLDTLNNLEKALNKPLTSSGQQIASKLSTASLELPLPEVLINERTQFIHQLYKLSLHQFLNKTESARDFQAFKLIGGYLVSMAQGQPSQQYWQLVNSAFSHIDELVLNDARLRVFINLENAISLFLASPEGFEANLTALADILSIVIGQEDQLAQQIRSQLNIGHEFLTDTQLKTLSQHLYGPDFDTMQTVSQLILSEMNKVRNDIEYNYQNMSAEKAHQLQSNLMQLAHTFKLLNLNEAASELSQQASSLSQINILSNENYAQQLMKSILSAMNAIGILVRHYSSNRLQIRVNNTNISLDRLDEAHQTLLNETKNLTDFVCQSLTLYANDQTQNIEAIAGSLKELAGAAEFLGSTVQQNALLETAKFVQQQIDQNQPFNHDQIHYIFNVLAGLDMLVDNLKNKQPVLQSMFDVALLSSQQLQKKAA